MEIEVRARAMACGGWGGGVSRAGASWAQGADVGVASWAHLGHAREGGGGHPMQRRAGHCLHGLQGVVDLGVGVGVGGWVGVGGLGVVEG